MALVGTKKPALSVKQRKFLAAYSGALSVSKAALASGIGRRTHYNWLGSSDAYRMAFEEALADGLETLEAEVRRRAVDGVVKKLYHAGQPVIDPETGQQAFEVQYSDRLLIALLRRHSPAWGDSLRVSGELGVEHSGRLQAIAAEYHADPDYIEFLRQRTCEVTEP